MWQTLGHCHEPGTFFGAERVLVNLLHHGAREARAVAEDEVGVGPLEREQVAYCGLEPRRGTCWPPKHLLVRSWIGLGQVCLVFLFEPDRHVLERFEDLNAPALFELVHQGCGQNAFARPMAEVNESAAGHIERIMPAVRVLVLPRALDPLENLEK